MGGMARRLALAASVCAGCASFDAPPDDGHGSPPSPGPAATPGADLPASTAPPETTSASIGDGSSSDSPAPKDVVIFDDDFERAEPMGEWTGEFGNLALLPHATGGGTMLVAKVDASFATSSLVKQLTGVKRSVKLAAKVRLAGAPKFEWSTDYCDVVAVWLDGYVLASFFVNGAGEWKAWTYGPKGSGGAGTTFAGVAVTTFANLELDVKWDDSDVTLVASVNGMAKTVTPMTLTAGAGNATPSIAVGPSCVGNPTPPSATVEYDDVVVRTQP